jgi:glycerol-3-phosphate dehydrogenase
MGLAGLGDTLVTALGGRNRLYGELIGEGAEPRRALRELMDRGMTVEGVDSTVDVKRLAGERGQILPFFERIHAILFDREPADSLMECLKG